MGNMQMFITNASPSTKYSLVNVLSAPSLKKRGLIAQITPSLVLPLLHRKSLNSLRTELLTNSPDSYP